MPQEVYLLKGYNRERTMETLTEAMNRGAVVGDISGEETERTKGVLSLYIKVNGEKVSFQISPYGKIIISHPDNSKLRRAKSKLNTLIVSEEWVPASWSPEKDEGAHLVVELPPSHVMNIASGLKALISIGRYHVEGELAAKPEYAEFALQHLEEGWPEIYEIYDKEGGVRCGIDKLMDELSSKVEKRLEDRGIPIAVPQNIRYLMDYLLAPSDLSKIELRINKTIRTEPMENGWSIYGGAYLLCSTKEGKDAESLKEQLKEHTFNVLVENKVLLQELKNLREQLMDLDRRFKDEVELLILKLVDMGKLKGGCGICEDASKRSTR